MVVADGAGLALRTFCRNATTDGGDTLYNALLSLAKLSGKEIMRCSDVYKIALGHEQRKRDVELLVKSMEDISENAQYVISND